MSNKITQLAVSSIQAFSSDSDNMSRFAFRPRNVRVEDLSSMFRNFLDIVMVDDIIDIIERFQEMYVLLNYYKINVLCFPETVCRNTMEVVDEREL